MVVGDVADVGPFACAEGAYDVAGGPLGCAHRGGRDGHAHHGAAEHDALRTRLPT